MTGYNGGGLEIVGRARRCIVEEEVRRVIEEAESTARRVLTEHLEDLHKLSQALLEHETLSGDEVRALLRGETINRGDPGDQLYAAAPVEGRTEDGYPRVRTVRSRAAGRLSGTVAKLTLAAIAVDGYAFCTTSKRPLMPALRFRFAVLAFAAFGFTGAAHAEVLDYAKATQTPWYMPSEGRIGFGATDPTIGTELSADVTAQLLLQPIGNDTWWNELRFRPEMGINGNLEGRTSFVDLGMTFDLINYCNFFFDFTLGGAFHDGYLHTNDDDTSHKRFGSRFEFRENLEAGYEFTPRYSASLFVDHLSNGGMLSKYNQGIETAGVHFNVKFDQ